MTSKEKKSFYITTTIPYVNADPHIGFALELVQSDAIARYQRLLGKEVFEHDFFMRLNCLIGKIKEGIVNRQPTRFSLRTDD